MHGGHSTSDRVFLDSEDISNPKDMSVFYRESLMSQTADRFQGDVVRPGAYKMRIQYVYAHAPVSSLADTSTISAGRRYSQNVRSHLFRMNQRPISCTRRVNMKEDLFALVSRCSCYLIFIDFF